MRPDKERGPAAEPSPDIATQTTAEGYTERTAQRRLWARVNMPFTPNEGANDERTPAWGRPASS